MALTQDGIETVSEASEDVSRYPTPDPVLYEWHSAAMRGENPPVHEIEVHCGWFVRAYSYRGLLYPAQIFMSREIDEETGLLLSDETLRCILAKPGDGWPTIAGHEADAEEEWPYLAKKPISKSEYEALMAQVLFSHKYTGPSRPFVRWFDEREVAADFLRYQGAMTDAVGTN